MNAHRRVSSPDRNKRTCKQRLHLKCLRCLTKNVSVEQRPTRANDSQHVGPLPVGNSLAELIPMQFVDERMLGACRHHLPRLRTCLELDGNGLPKRLLRKCIRFGSKNVDAFG